MEKPLKYFIGYTFMIVGEGYIKHVPRDQYLTKTTYLGMLINYRLASLGGKRLLLQNKSFAKASI
jgi:hypothetical protein